MKNIFLILLSSLVLCGCSKEPTVSPGPAIDRIQAGKVSLWSSGYSLYVEKRDGTNVEDVWISGTLSNGVKQTVTAETATISPRVIAGVTNDRSVILYLHNMEIQAGSMPRYKRKGDTPYILE